MEQTSIKHSGLFKRLAEPLLEHFGINYFGYPFVSNEGNWFTLVNNPHWLLYSAEQQFDPSLIQYRKQGIGTALYYARLNEAKKQGYETYRLTSDANGIRAGCCSRV
ncbi:GNAT family N-acetyltransferase [Legionella maioricensis]|uniref:GNAT family N-acetyltransferase n=1 Tax=Legionella maioricensis TaxID=2896528 RepID=A0A9X2CYY2_9GAMM|nr:GNAT family N-acetyltransferase [Legionella maioricensis]MCL9683351.1 GNAT family N-acetyltransferase [Legionella maioricensis]MCL9685953.1 GNAT family N-acetyltransferase [Legionella maioricensis]